MKNIVFVKAVVDSWNKTKRLIQQEVFQLNQFFCFIKKLVALQHRSRTKSSQADFLFSHIMRFYPLSGRLSIYHIAKTKMQSEEENRKIKRMDDKINSNGEMTICTKNSLKNRHLHIQRF